MTATASSLSHPARAPLPQDLDLPGSPALLPGEQELPHSFGPNLESDPHRECMDDLIYSLRDWCRERGHRDIYCSGNMAMYYSAEQVKKNDFIGPDVFVVKGTSLRRRLSWVVWEELRTPDVVIELVSPSTAARDRGEKMDIYARSLKVGEYYLYNPLRGELTGFQLMQEGLYVAMSPDQDGCLPCAQLGLRLGVFWPEEWGAEPEAETPMLRWREPRGDWLPTRRQRTESERQRAEQERQRAEQARQRAEEECQRAEEERQRAEQERLRADEQARRAERLAEQLRRLGIEPEAR